MQLSTLADLKLGNLIFGFFQCIDKSVRTTRLGDLFIDLKLKDSRGIIRAKIWTNVDYFSKKFNINDIVSIKAEVIEFNSNMELNIKFINADNINYYEEYGFNSSLIIGSISQSVDKTISFIYSEISLLPIKHRKIIKKIYKDNEHIIKKVPIEKENYQLKGGFIKYIYDLLKFNKKIEINITNLDSNKVKICILIMYLGYIKFYNDDDIFTRSDLSRSVGISDLNSFIIYPYISDLDDQDNIFYIQSINAEIEMVEHNILYVKSLISLNDISNA